MLTLCVPFFVLYFFSSPPSRVVSVATVPGVRPGGGGIRALAEGGGPQEEGGACEGLSPNIQWYCFAPGRAWTARVVLGCCSGATLLASCFSSFGKIDYLALSTMIPSYTRSRGQWPVVRLVCVLLCQQAYAAGFGSPGRGIGRASIVWHNVMFEPERGKLWCVWKGLSRIATIVLAGTHVHQNWNYGPRERGEGGGEGGSIILEKKRRQKTGINRVHPLS